MSGGLNLMHNLKMGRHNIYESGTLHKPVLNVCYMRRQCTSWQQ